MELVGWLVGWLFGYWVYDASFLPTDHSSCVAFVPPYAMPVITDFTSVGLVVARTAEVERSGEAKVKPCHPYKLLFLEP